MGLLKWIVIGGIAKSILSDPSNYSESDYEDYMLELEMKRQQEEEEWERKKEEDRRRRNTPCEWIGISQVDFKNNAIKFAKDIKRLWVDEVDGPFIRCTVKSTSGISSWEFEVDFNDWGSITGWYKIYTDNYDSSIPGVYADRVAGYVKRVIDNYKIDEGQKRFQKMKKWRAMERCQYCGGSFDSGFFGKHCSVCKKKKDY